MPLIPALITAPAYVPSVKPAAPLTRHPRWGEMAEHLPPVRPLIEVPAPVPTPFRKTGRSTTPRPKSANATPGYLSRKAAEFAKKRTRQYVQQLKQSQNLRSGMMSRINLTFLSSAAMLLADATKAYQDSKPINQTEVEAEREKRKNRSLSCIEEFTTYFDNFEQSFDYHQEILNWGMHTQDNVKRQRRMASSARN